MILNCSCTLGITGCCFNGIIISPQRSKPSEWAMRESKRFKANSTKACFYVDYITSGAKVGVRLENNCAREHTFSSTGQFSEYGLVKGYQYYI